MKRIVQPELLDTLPVHDPRAVASRGDLKRINTLMGHVNLMVTQTAASCCEARRVADLGAGDGHFMRRVAERLCLCWKSVEVVLVDRQRDVSPDTLAEFCGFSWNARSVAADAFDWLGGPASMGVDAVFANLFLHHFEDRKLSELLRLIALRARFFIACEPRRAQRALFASRLLGLIGCNSVTRHDAVVSVRAGFTGRELSALWPSGDGWELREEEAGLFSHLFVARKKD